MPANQVETVAVPVPAIPPGAMPSVRGSDVEADHSRIDEGAAVGMPDGGDHGAEARDLASALPLVLPGDMMPGVGDGVLRAPARRPVESGLTGTPSRRIEESDTTQAQRPFQWAAMELTRARRTSPWAGAAGFLVIAVSLILWVILLAAVASPLGDALAKFDGRSLAPPPGCATPSNAVASASPAGSRASSPPGSSAAACGD